MPYTLTPTGQAALEHLYATFEGYPLNRAIQGSPLTVSDSDKQTLPPVSTLISTLWLCLLLVLTIPTFAQPVDQALLEEKVESRFNVSLDTLDVCDYVIINGIPYSEEDLTHALNEIDRADVRFTTLANFSNTTIFHKRCDYLILVGTDGQWQKKKMVRNLLSEIQSELDEHLEQKPDGSYTCDSCQLVLVDGQPLRPPELQKRMKRLRPKHIEYIVSYNWPNPAVFGPLAANGLTEIYLKEKL